MKVFLNGKFVDARDAKISVFDPGFLYGDGIFETLRTYQGKVWKIEKHLERLYESAKMRGWKLSWKPAELALAIEKTIQRNGYPESRIRMTITPGVKDPTLFIWVQQLDKLPYRAYRDGVSVITFPLERPFPQMKTTSMQPLLIARAEMRKKKAFEALLINRKDYVTEGTWTNVFIVKKKILTTPKIGVLLGTTRDTVLTIAKPLFRIKLGDISLRDLYHADEVFLTSAPKGIVPVTKVDGRKIRGGKPGPITQELIRLFLTSQ